MYPLTDQRIEVPGLLDVRIQPANVYVRNVLMSDTAGLSNILNGSDSNPANITRAIAWSRFVSHKNGVQDVNCVVNAFAH